MTPKQQKTYDNLGKKEKILWLDYDLDHLEMQRTILVDAIKNGNWEGMSDNLKVRKQNLIELNKKILNVIHTKNSLMLS